jgi:hypothetical protein
MKSAFRLLVVVCILAIALVAARSSAQAPIPRAVVPVPTPTVISGDDIGFRVEGLRGKTTPVGKLVIRLNGQWVEPELSDAVQPRRLTAR